MKTEGASAATRARLAVFVREGVKRINTLMTHGLDEDKDGGLSLEKRIAFELKLLEEGKELIILEGDEGVSDIEEVRKENGRLRRRHAQYDQLLKRAGIDAERELGVLELLEVTPPVVAAPVVAAPVVEVVTAPVKVAPPEKVEAARAAKGGRSKGKAAGVGPGDYVPRMDGVGK